MTDADLIQRLIGRNETAFREFVEKYQSMVFNTCYNLLRHTNDAEDITQEVFIEVLESIHQFRSESKLSTWLYRIAINKSFNHLRKGKRKSIISSIGSIFSGENNKPFEIEDPSALDTPDTITYKDRSKVMKQAIDSLPENQRIAFTLNKFEELSYQEIAEVMNLSLSSIESLIHRAKLGLQKKLVNFYKN